ncbi:MAG: GNAT family N-acetyltransferase [Rhodothermia bacterium]|nr:GNAT family N-acetyltransferase [Rhodothermia bacterium]
MKDIDIRNASLTDADALSSLWSRFLREQGTLDPKLAPSADAVERFRADLPEWIHDTTRVVVVGERRGEIVAFVSALLWSLPPIFEAGPELYVEYFYVDESHRRDGIGTAMFEAAKRRAEEMGAGRIRLAVADENETGKKFWTSVGGRTVVREIVVPVHGADVPPKAPLGFTGNQ